MIRHLLIFMVFLLSSNLAALEPCGKHRFDISHIRDVAKASFLESHKNGGKLFRTCFVSTPEDSAYDLFRWRKTYSEFSEVFNEFLCICQPKGMEALYTGYSQVGDLFFNLYTTCIETHSNACAHYEKGKIYFDRGLFGDCLSELQLIDSEEQTKEEEYAPVFLLQGKALVEAEQFHRAIDVLIKFIELDPSNKEAHLYLALAWFETGFADHAVNDYLGSGKSKNPSKVKLLVSREFKDGLLEGLKKGISEYEDLSAPILLHSPYGLERPLWILGKQPVNYAINFSNICGVMVEMASHFFKTLTAHLIHDDYAEEIILLCEKFDSLSDTEKGNLMGCAIGKYGVDVFSGSTSLQIISTFRKLKEANRLCNLEAIALSEKNKKNILKFALNHIPQKETFFKSGKINCDKQNKYLNHNYLFESQNAQELLTKFAGKGIPVKNFTPGDLTYKELVNFGEVIGSCIDPKTSEKLSTTWGEIHYSRSGACIIPVLAKLNLSE